MACPDGTITACDFGQWLVNQTPVFDELIMEDITPTDGWIGNVSLFELPFGSPPEITQDRFRSVFPNTTKAWRRTSTTSCLGTPCDPPRNQIGWGADRLTFFEQEQTWETPLLCLDQMMNVTHAKQQLQNIISKTLKPSTSFIGSSFLRKNTMFWSKRKNMANASLTQFTYEWTLGGADGDEEIYFDTSASPNQVFHLVPQMLQNRFSPLMRIGYGGENPFKDTAPFIELVTDMDTAWFLDKLGGQQGVGTGNNPSVAGNWRFTEWGAANAYWRYGFSGQIGNYMVRADEWGLRFNFVADLGAGSAPNRYRYQIVLPYTNVTTTGAGGSAGIGREENPDYDSAQYAISFISHKKGLQLGVPSMANINPEMPFKHRNLAGQWEFHMHDLGADIDGNPINNEWGNKGKFASWFKYYVRPLHYEFLEVFFHKREQFCIPEIDTCHDDPGYPYQNYNSAPEVCPDVQDGLYGTGVPTGSEDGPIV